ncbi:cell envelope integrity protein TolA [Avibacterium avium]|uniref:cell envelope integrity protein TolA n=1 Tax=Avibacterium avium TaxID=751 RepID=UPI003BF7BA11
MEHQDLEKYGNLPTQVRQALLATDEKQPSEHIENDEQEQDNSPATPEEVPQQSEQQQIEPPQTNVEQEDNDVKAWKGRLNKEQEAHKSTNARLLAEAEARQQAELKAKEAEEKLTALQQQLEQQKQPESQPPQKAEDELSTTEEEEIVSLLGATGRKLLDRLRQQPANPSAQPPEDIGKIVDERLKQAQEQQAQQTRQQAFIQALNETVPELQGLMNNSAFTQFLNSKVVDFYGNTAAMFVGHIGKTYDIEKLPQFRALVDEFNQSQQPPKPAVTAPPSNSGAAMNKKAGVGKKKLTPEVISRMRILMNTGQTEELRRLQDEYDID